MSINSAFKNGKNLNSVSKQTTPEINIQRNMKLLTIQKEFCFYSAPEKPFPTLVVD